MNPTEALTGLAAFLQGFYVNGFLVEGEGLGGLRLYTVEGELIGFLQWNQELGAWVTEDARLELKDHDKEH